MGCGFGFGGSKPGAVGANLLPKIDTTTKQQNKTKSTMKDRERERHPGSDNIV